MGIRFRKSFKLAPGIRMNLSASGLSASFGPRGASVSVGKRGVYGNAGFPGTGLSTRQKLSGNQSQSRTAYRAPSPVPKITEVPLTVGVGDDGVLFFKDRAGAPLSEHLVTIAKKQHGDAIKGLIQRKCDEINEQIEAVGDLHLDTPSPHERPRFVACAYDNPRPTPPTSQAPGFFAKFLASQREKVDTQNAQAVRTHAVHLREWEAGLATHKQTEERRRRHIEELIYSDPEAMESQLEENLKEIAWPRETLVTTEVFEGGTTALIDVDLPEIEDMPSKTAGVPSRGMKLSVKDMSPTQVQKFYMRHVHSIGFRIIGEIFASLPQAQRVILSGYSQRRDTATGQVGDEYLYSVRVERSEWGAIDFTSAGLNNLDVVEALGRFNLRRTMSKTGVFKPIDPYSVEKTGSESAFGTSV